MTTQVLCIATEQSQNLAEVGREEKYSSPTKASAKTVVQPAQKITLCCAHRDKS